MSALILFARACVFLSELGCQFTVFDDESSAVSTMSTIPNGPNLGQAGSPENVSRAASWTKRLAALVNHKYSFLRSIEIA